MKSVMLSIPIDEYVRAWRPSVREDIRRKLGPIVYAMLYTDDRGESCRVGKAQARCWSRKLLRKGAR